MSIRSGWLHLANNTDRWHRFHPKPSLLCLLTLNSIQSAPYTFQKILGILPNTNSNHQIFISSPRNPRIFESFIKNNFSNDFPHFSIRFPTCFHPFSHPKKISGAFARRRKALRTSGSPASGPRPSTWVGWTGVVSEIIGWLYIYIYIYIYMIYGWLVTD